MLLYEQADAVPDDAAKGFGTSALLDAAAAEGAKPCATAGSNKPIAVLKQTSAIMTDLSPLFILG